MLRNTDDLRMHGIDRGLRLRFCMCVCVCVPFPANNWPLAVWFSLSRRGKKNPKKRRVYVQKRFAAKDRNRLIRTMWRHSVPCHSAVIEKELELQRRSRRGSLKFRPGLVRGRSVKRSNVDVMRRERSGGGSAAAELPLSSSSAVTPQPLWLMLVQLHVLGERT